MGGRSVRSLARLSAAVVVVAIAAGIVTSNRFAGPVAPADSLTALDARAAYLKGVDLVRGARSAASLLYFRMALAQRPDLWQIHADYASALMNTAVEVTSRRGVSAAVTCSTRERAALAREALERYASAEHLAPTPRDRAFVFRHRAASFAAWGLAWEAREDQRRAALEDAAGASPRAEKPVRRANVPARR